MTTSSETSHPSTASGARDDLIRPEALRRIAEEKEMKRAQEALAKMKKAEADSDLLHQTFMEREIKPEAMHNVSAAVRRAAEDGHTELMVFSFPSSWCTDKGRAINNYEPNWPETLTGFGKRAYDFYVTELRPAGYKLRAQVLDYPDGFPGKVGIFLSW